MCFASLDLRLSRLVYLRGSHLGSVPVSQSMCALSVCLSSCRQPSGARRRGGGGRASVDKFNVWLSLLETPTGLAPPSLPVSLAQARPLLRAPLCRHPPVEPSPDLLPRRPTFLRLAMLKGACTGTHSNHPPCPLCAHSDDPKHTKTRLDTAATCAREVAHGPHP